MRQAPDISSLEVLLRLGLAAFLGGAIGIERELRERGAGLRTHMLVSIGSALFTLVSAYGFREFLNSGDNVVRADPTRIAAQIVTGIGFLGAGAIIRQGFSVRGLTTAATLWVVAAIGLAAGAGYYAAAVMTTALVILGLWPLRIWAFRALRRLRAQEESLLLAELTPTSSPLPLLAKIEEIGGQVKSLELASDEGRQKLSIEVDFPREDSVASVVAELGQLEDVLSVHWGREQA